MTLLQSGIAKPSSGYDIDQSLRLNDDSDHYLEREWTSTGNRKTWTMSWWFKGLSRVEKQFCGVAANADGTVGSNIWPGMIINTNIDTGGIQIQHYTGSSFTCLVDTKALIADPSSWYHCVIRWDTTQSTDTNRLRIYLNGELQELTTSGGSYTLPAQDLESYWNTNTYHHRIGKGGNSNADFYGYQAEWYFIDGSSLGPESFGETNSATNQWVPIEYTGSYGTNGFYLPFSSTELANSFTDSSAGLDTFTSTGTTSWTAPAGVTSVEYLVVGGGGGGGGVVGGGGGAGDFKTGTLSVTPGSSYTVTVGAGGSGGVGNGNGSDGSSSVFSTITSTGGGGGAYNANNGRDGASGGGGAHNNGGTGGTGGSGTGTNGNDGGDGNGGTFPNGASGGGGGSGGAGGSPGGTTGGSGGAGTSSSISGSALFYAAGGGGWGNSAGSGGSSIGGNSAGGSGTTNGSDATANRGSGGGGGANAGSNGGAGSAGIVILKYRPGTGFQTITANGDVAYSRAQKKVGSSSIYFEGGNDDYLSVSDSSDWDIGTGDFTFECWYRRSAWSGSGPTGYGPGYLWDFSDGTSRISGFLEDDNAGNRINWFGTDWPNTTEDIESGTLNTWHHIALVRQSGTGRWYHNGVQKNTLSSFNVDFSGTWTNHIGIRYAESSGRWWPWYGYIDEFRVSDTCRYPDGTTFTPSTTAFTADANTLLLIHSDFNGGLGADNSGNTNDFTPTNLVATDQVLDSPTNNFATLNPLDENGITLSEGNLKAVGSTSPWSEVRNTIGVSSGKWYWEVLYVSTAELEGWVAGIRSSRGALFQAHWYSGSWSTATNGHCYGLLDSGTKVSDGSSTASFTSALSANDIIGFALDLDSGTTTLEVYVNGSSVGTMYSSLQTGEHYTPAFSLADPAGSTSVGVMNLGSDSSFAGNKTAQGNTDGNGKGDFYYPPPSGFLALCTDNLSDPSIADPTAYFNTVAYSGNGSTQSITTGLQPDFTWIKGRSYASNHRLIDSVRGAGERLSSNLTDAETTESNGLTSFNSDGFSVGTEGGYNNSGQTFVSWNWKAGGTASSNTDGSITSSVSANTTAGFSIISYAGNSSTATVGHGLSQGPEIIFVKSRSNTHSWSTGATPIGWTERLEGLNNTNAAATNDAWDDTAPSSSVIYLTSDGSSNETGNDYICYAFHSVDGYSKVGSYTGSGSSDGPFVYTGFRPAFVMVKSSNAIASWWMGDTARETYNGGAGTYGWLQANASDAEADYTAIDHLSNGFKLRDVHGGLNGSGNTYLYLAFAESPFKTSNAR